MANCARLVSSDHFSSNGVVHMVDRVIQPARHTIGMLGKSEVRLTDDYEHSNSSNCNMKLALLKHEF